MPESYERRLTMLIILNSLKNLFLTITHNANYINLFGSSVLAGSGYQIYFHRMKHIVATDYELLKKSLGYPSENFFNIFVRMTFKQKMRSLISWINMIWIFAPIILAFFSSNSKSTFHNTGSIIFFSMVTFFPLIKINKWINNLKD